MSINSRDDNKIVINRFLVSARDYPGRPALETGEETYTYAEILRHAASIAASVTEMLDAGPGPGLDSSEGPSNHDTPFVGIMADKSLAAYAGILGTLMASCAYVPLNPRFPAGRNAEILKKAGIKAVITSPQGMPHLDGVLKEMAVKPGVIIYDPEDKADTLVPELITLPSSTAYLLFTSGSTGTPKGVAVSNENLAAYLDHVMSVFDFKPEDRFSQTFDLTFDLSVHDLFVCWSAGGCLVIPDDNTSFGLYKYLKDKKLTAWFSVPSVAVLMARMRLLKKHSLPGLRVSLFCGEPLLADTALKWGSAAGASRIANLYGPTEATIAISMYELARDKVPDQENGIVSLGNIFENQQYRLEYEGKERKSVTGELLLSGTQVVKSYYRNPDATKESFVTLGQPPKLWYRTGDLVRDVGGELFYLGRTDAEVKVSGYRVNLLEVDHHLRKASGTSMAASITLERGGGLSVIGCIGEEEGVMQAEAAILEYCKSAMPWYMVPEKIIFVNEMPLNVNGKIDRNKLKESLTNER